MLDLDFRFRFIIDFRSRIDFIIICSFRKIARHESEQLIFNHERSTIQVNGSLSKLVIRRTKLTIVSTTFFNFLTTTSSKLVT